MNKPVEIILHVPACYVEPWHELPLADIVAQEPFLAVRYPMPISEGGIATPVALAAMGGASIHIKQLGILGRALHSVLESEKPRYHRSRITREVPVQRSGGDGIETEVGMIESSGTTVLVTGNDGRAVLFASWDAGEPVESALGRLSEARRILRLPTPVARAFMQRTFIRGLPPPQAVLSNVIPLGERYPETALGGYDQGGGGIPIVIAVGIEQIRIVFDHRVYNPPDMIEFGQLYRAAILAELDLVGQAVVNPDR